MTPVRQDPNGPPGKDPAMLGKLDVHFGLFFPPTVETIGPGGTSLYGAVLAWEGAMSECSHSS